ncbi:pyrophosphatase PpaX [Planococcus lenghuensis]|uniref:Pyrophosphatase PpaX n=1 Tax=Planococcus lenghuensis TaxID=2213202 RepID=A0A1Q2KX13_9BACL|nr:pyrophosphatase PpaX [Planococcus lenghuensis]AQQ52654.1 pyrophosphatase PpaX [Planococcus lenghuensis]
MTNAFQALLFDFDGTLLDTNELIEQTFLGVLDEFFPGRYTSEDVISFNGPPLHETFKAVAPEQTEQLIKAYRELNQELHDDLVKEYDGVRETVRLLKARGHKLAIVSTKRRSVIERGLALMDLGDVFDLIISLDDVTHAKPHPEPVQLALEKLGVQAEHALMIGDNSHDIEGGQNAGVRTAGVAWSAKGEVFLARFNPDFMLTHISDLLDISKERVR